MPLATAVSRYPACPIELYASIRFRLRCASATRFPTTIVIAANHQTISVHTTVTGPSASSSTRSIAANAAALTAAAMNAVMGVGAPSYTSGVHMWNGTAATLKAKPTSSMPIPISSTVFSWNTHVVVCT